MCPPDQTSDAARFELRSDSGLAWLPVWGRPQWAEWPAGFVTCRVAGESALRLVDASQVFAVTATGNRRRLRTNPREEL